jgi:hypothetical protein
MEPSRGAPADESPDRDIPYLSVVFAWRIEHDNSDLVGRLQASLDGWIEQTNRHNLRTELLLVEWNALGGGHRRERALRWPDDTGLCDVRILEIPITVPHGHGRHGGALAEMIARNVAIRRARGEFVLVSSAGVLFSNELIEFLASRRLEADRLYRIDRHDVAAGIPLGGKPDEQLAWCASHVTRILAREGTFQVTSDGFRQNGAEDIARTRAGIHFGAGWFPVERSITREPFRWIGNEAEFFLSSRTGAGVMELDVETGPGIAKTPAALQILDRVGAPVAEWQVAGRTRVALRVPLFATGDPQLLRLLVFGGGLPILDDPRILNLRVFRCDWIEPGAAATPLRSYARTVWENRSMLVRMLGDLRASNGIMPLLWKAPLAFHAVIDLLRRRSDDVFEAGSNLPFGPGWWDLTQVGQERFRWASEDAQLMLAINRKDYQLSMLVEPAQGWSNTSCELVVRDSRAVEIARRSVNGLTLLRFAVPMPEGTATTLSLRLEGEGVPAEDTKAQNFRLLACASESSNARRLEASSSDGREPWSVLQVDTRPAEIDWAVRLEAGRAEILDSGNPAFLHTNAGADFTLMSRAHWRDLRGYSELCRAESDVEALLCYAAHFAGVREVVLQDPMRIFHIGPSASAEGEGTLAERQTSSIGENLQCQSDDDSLGLIALMRRRRSLLILNLDAWGLGDTIVSETNLLRLDSPPSFPTRESGMALARSEGEPYLSVVIAARNDDHGGNMLGRMQAFLTAWLSQSRRYGLASEIIVVEWNPPADRPKLIDALEWPSGPSPCSIRFVEVPQKVHQRFPHANALPMHQMIAKNVGIRRARGEFVLATNLDIVFSAELMQFLSQRQLVPGRMYRIDRHDVSREIPANANADELLAFCGSHILRVFTREGCFEFDPPGLRKFEGADIAPETGIRFGHGWYGVENYGAECFRWIAREAEVLFQEPVAGRRLLIDADTGPSAPQGAVGIEIIGPEGFAIASGTVEGRCHLLIELTDPIAKGFRLRVVGAGLPLAHDLRMLNLRAFGVRWERPSDSPAAVFPNRHSLLQVVRVGSAVNWDSLVLTTSPPATPIKDAAYLHTNACGDFTLLSQHDWFKLRGYPEFPLWPMHIDSLFCYAAHHAGLREVILNEPMRMFHIEHLSGAGWTPEGEAERNSRITAKGVHAMEYGDFILWVNHMRRLNAPIITTREDWGLGGVTLEERVVG